MWTHQPGLHPNPVTLRAPISESQDGPERCVAQLLRYLLGQDDDPAGLDLNEDGKVDVADLIKCLETAPEP